MDSLSNSSLWNRRSNELIPRHLHDLHSTFRTFDTIVDFLINAFDELAEAILSRGAALVINSLFDRASLFLLGF